MDLALILFGLFLSWLGGGRDEQPRKISPAPAGGPPPPWPQVTPEGLPPFPGSGWEYDEPPPSPVVARARQLLSTLWGRGQGAFKIEQTAGRWIAYRAEITRGNKHGVVAYRERAVGPAPVATSAPAPAPAFRPPSPPVPTVPTSTAPAPFVPAPAAPVAPRTTLALPTLRVGMGMPPGAPLPDVRLLQGKLAIPADGRFGQQTLAAVREFQRRRGLVIDGIVGPATWTALFAVRT